MSQDPPLLNACPTCNSEVDVSACPPYSEIVCPECEAPMRARRVIQQYKIDSEIGRGGMSRVFLATDPALDRRVALKVLLDRYSHDDERLKQFEKEAHTTASFSHPNVVKVYAVGRDQGNLFIVMEFVENGSLDELITKQGKLTESQSLTWALETAHGLQAAYQNGLIHRDVKPGNILLAKDRSAKLVDFGLALMFQRDVDESQEIWATPYYVSPEKLHGESEDHRSDIYSLGATLYHLLAGKPSFEVKTGTFEELHAAKIKAVPLKPAAPQISTATCKLVERMMSPDPDDRPSTYDELIAEMEDCKARLGPKLALRGKGSATRFVTDQHARKGAKLRRRIIGAFTAGLVIAIGFGWYVSNTRPPVAPSVKSTKPAIEDATISLDDEAPALGDQTQEAFLKARQELLAGNWEAAGRAFRAVYETKEAGPALKQWALYHRGLTKLLSEAEPESRAVFALLDKEKCRRPELDQFFHGLRNPLQNDDSVPVTLVEETESGFCHPASLLVYGLKNWERGAYEEAKAHLNAFAKAEPGPNFQWINAYKTLVEDQLADLEWLPNLVSIDSIDDKSVLEKEEHMLRDLMARAQTDAARNLAQSRQVAARKRLDSWDEVAEEAEKAASVLRIEEEVETWKTLHGELTPLRKTMSFGMGIELLAAKRDVFQSRSGKESFLDQLYLWMKAEIFLDHLVAAIPGRQGSLVPKNGETLTGEITAASRQSVTVRLSSGEVTLPFDQLDPAGLAQLAKQLIAETYDSNLFYERQEELVIFACLTDLKHILETQADALSRENRPFRERWARVQAFEKTLAEHLRHG